MKSTFAALTIAAVIMFPSAGASGETVSYTDVQLCVFIVPCRLTADVTLTVVSCDSQNCTVNVRGTALGESYVPGLHELLMTADGGSGGGGVCAPYEAIQTVLSPLGSCAHVCSTKAIGVEAACGGSVNVTTFAPRGGHPGPISVDTYYNFDTQFVGQALSSLFFGVRQLPNGTVEVFRYPT